MRPLAYIDGHTYSYSDMISANGATIGGISCNVYFPGPCQGVVWNANGEVETLMLQDDTSSGLSAVSRDGSTAVGDSFDAINDIQTAVVWTASDGILAIGPGGYRSHAQSVSNDGGFVLGTMTSSLDPGIRDAFVWTQGGGIEVLTLPDHHIKHSVLNNAA
jgi:uncharacterized membrane protein